MGARDPVDEMGVHVQGVVGASIVGVCAHSAMSPFDGVMEGLGGMQMGWEGVLGLLGRCDVGLVLTKHDGGLVERKLLALGTGPIDPLVSVTQLNCCGSCGVALCMA